MKTKSLKVLIIVAIAILLFTSLLIYFKKNTREITYDNIGAIDISLSISAEDLMKKQVSKNQSLKEYHGKYVEVTGEVMRKRPLNSEMTHSGQIVLSEFIFFYFSVPDEVKKISNVKTGDTVTLIGKYIWDEEKLEFDDSLLYKIKPN